MASTLKRRTAENVRAALARRKLTRGALMPILDLSYTAVQRRYQGDIAYDVDELGKIASAFGIPINELINDDGARDSPVLAAHSPAELRSNAGAA